MATVWNQGWSNPSSLVEQIVGYLDETPDRSKFLSSLSMIVTIWRLAEDQEMREGISMESTTYKLNLAAAFARLLAKHSHDFPNSTVTEDQIDHLIIKSLQLLGPDQKKRFLKGVVTFFQDL